MSKIYDGKSLRNCSFFSLKHGDLCNKRSGKFWKRIPEYITDYARGEVYFDKVLSHERAPYNSSVIHYSSLYRNPHQRFYPPNPEYPGTDGVKGFKIVEGWVYGNTTEFRFRMDPVDGTYKDRSWKNYFGSYYRRPKTTQERRKSFNYDKSFIRAKRNNVNLINAWDDKPKHTEKSWKFNTKKRKQWM